MTSGFGALSWLPRPPGSWRPPATPRPWPSGDATRSCPLASILAARRQRLGHFAVSGFALDEPLPVANLRVTTPAGTGQPPRTTG
jgi:hypothetical protein